MSDGELDMELQELNSLHHNQGPLVNLRLPPEFDGISVFL